MRYFGKVFAFILFVIALKFFNDGNMYWWFFMFGFIITSGFLIGEEGIDDEQVNAILHTKHGHWYNNAHCMECGYVNKACVCKPVVNNHEEDKDWPKDWEDYKATYVEDEGDDSIIVDIDAEIKYKTDDNERKVISDDIPF